MLASKQTSLNLRNHDPLSKASLDTTLDVPTHGSLKGTLCSQLLPPRPDDSTYDLPNGAAHVWDLPNGQPLPYLHLK